MTSLKSRLAIGLFLVAPPFASACGSTDNLSARNDGGGGASGNSSAGTSSSGSLEASTGNGGSTSGAAASGGNSSSGSGAGSGSSAMGASSGGPTSGSGISTGSSGGFSGKDGGNTSGSGSSIGGDAGAGDGGDGPPMVQQFDTNCLGVPDPDIAANDTLVGMVGQWTAYFYKKADGSADHQYKWTALQGSLVGDTHIVYDKTSKRWFLTTIVDLGGNNFGTQVMVSSDATASSWQASVPAKQTGLIDNPQPTVTSDKVLIVFHGNSAWVVDKAALYNGNAALVQPTATNLPSADNWVAVKYGGDPPSTAYAVTLIDSTTMGWIAVDGTHAANNISLKLNRITVPTVNSYPFGPNLYAAAVNGVSYEAGQVKAMAQNGHIYWAKTTACGGSLCERLFDIDTSTNTAKTTDFNLAGNQMWWGVPGVDIHQNVWMLATASTSQGPMGLALMGVYASGLTYAPRNILMGKAQVGSGQVRMGDYTSAAQDPDGSVWLIGMYGASNPNPLNSENNLGCRAVHVTVN